MKDHFDNNFKLHIRGQRTITEKDKGAAGQKSGIKGGVEDKTAPKDPEVHEHTDPNGLETAGTFLKSLLSAFNEEEAQIEENKSVIKAAPQKAGTKVKANVKLFYSDDDETIGNLTNLHQFNYDPFISIGFKPKAKDLKTFIEDIRECEFVQYLEREGKVSLLLDGKQVRFGYQD